MLKIIYRIFTLFVIIIAALLCISVFPITGNYKVLVVLSGSMEPSIKTGSVVVVKPYDDYKVGDIITFTGKSKGVSTTHRIVEIEKNEKKAISYTTKGDANNAPDERKVSPREIIGKVIFNVPYVGYAIETAKKPLGFALIVIIPAALIIYDEAKNIMSEIKKLKKNKK